MENKFQNSQISQIIKDVLARIKPSAELKAQKQNAAKCLLAEIKKFGYNAEVVGYLAKDTDLAYTHDTDIDIFVKFPIQFNKKETEKSN